ncbi:Alpha/Beta hydrolase protein [Mycena galopus ATCC 62051]|nr:Alpha/Beta hydrolase protein [Mycena galopus ATCC 62051]
MAQYSHLSKPDPELPSDLPPMVPITADFVPTLRKKFQIPLSQKLELYKTRLPPDSMYKVEDHPIAIEDGEIYVRTVSPTPRGNETEFPVLVYFHPGGAIWFLVISTIETLRRLLGWVLAYFAIWLAPENPFPIGLNDSYAALKWTANNCKRLRGALDKGFLVGGASAGGNLAAAVTHRALKDPFFANHRITGHVLQIPALVHPAAYPSEYADQLLSFKQNAAAPLLTSAAMTKLYECLNGPPADPEVSPLLADHTGLPPAYIQVCGLDPLRDEGLLYERVLREQGIRTKLDIYPGVPHGFSFIFLEMTASKQWHADLLVGLQWVLESPK